MGTESLQGGRQLSRSAESFTADVAQGVAASPSLNPPRSRLKSRYDVVIVGAGHNGLIAAAYLAGAGFSVLVVEQRDYLGGAATSQRIFPEYDAMISRYAYLVSLLPASILSDLRLNFVTRRREIASFTPYQGRDGLPRGLIISNVDQDRTRDSVRTLTGHDDEWQRYQKFIELQRAITKIIWPTFLQPLRSRTSFIESLSTLPERRAWTAFVDRPVGEVIEEYLKHDVLRGLLMTDAKIGVFTHAHDPSLLQNRCFLYHVVGNGTGEWRVPVGGMHALADALTECCLSRGVSFHTGTRADRIFPAESPGKDHEVELIRENGTTRVAAHRVLVNASPRFFSHLMGEVWSPHPEDEGSVVKINMLLKRLPKLKTRDATSAEAFTGSFHLDEGYEQMQNSYQRARCGELSDPAPGELYCHSLTDNSILSPELRQQGYQTLTLFGLDMPWRLFEHGSEEARQHVGRLYLEGLNRVCAEPVEDCLARSSDGELCMEVRTARDLHDEPGLDLGNIFHNRLSWFFTDEETHAGTWGVETAWPRIYRCGSSALRGGAVSGIPGHNAAKCILEELQR